MRHVAAVVLAALVAAAVAGCESTPERWTEDDIPTYAPELIEHGGDLEPVGTVADDDGGEHENCWLASVWGEDYLIMCPDGYEWRDVR